MTAAQAHPSGLSRGFLLAGVLPAVPPQVGARWHTAYLAYWHATEHVDNTEPGDAVAATELAEASWAVASTWSEIANAPGLPWWCAVSARTAAEAFEDQAQTWAEWARSGV
jgi:hypothetical protein